MHENELKVVIWGFSTKVNGYRWEVVDPNTGVTVGEGVEFDSGNAELQANRFVDGYQPQPLKVYYRDIPVV